MSNKIKTGFPQRLVNLENENGNRKVMEHEKLAKSHVISHGSSDLESLRCFPQMHCKIRKTDGHGKSRNGHEKVMEKYFV